MAFLNKVQASPDVPHDALAPRPTAHLHGQILRFAIAGVCGFLVDAATLSALLALGCNFYVVRAGAFLAAASATWFFNRNVTFTAGTTPARPLHREWAHYVSLMMVGGTANYIVSALSYALIEQVAKWPILAIAMGSLAGMSLNFLSAKCLVFRQELRRPRAA